MTKRKPKEEHEKKGRPTSYNKDFDDLAYKFALLGGIDKKVAELFEISEVTLNAWKKKHPTFLKSLNEGKDIANANVAQALYQRAIGYSHKEVKLAMVEGKFTDEKEITKHYAPDTAAAMAWLKNRTGGKYQNTGTWSDKQEVEHSGSLGVTFNLDFGGG